MPLRYALIPFLAAMPLLSACSHSDAPAPAPSVNAQDQLASLLEPEMKVSAKAQDEGEEFDNALVAREGAGDPTLSETQKKQLQTLLDKLKDAKDLESALGLASRAADFGKAAYPEIQSACANLKGLPLVAAQRALYSTSRNNQQLDGAVQELAKIAGGKEDREMRLAAAEMLERLASPRHAAALREALANTFDTPVQIALSISLWNSSKDEKALKVLEDLLKASSSNTQLQAALALAKIQHFDSAKDYLRLIANEPTLRGETARALIERERLQRKLMSKIVEGTDENVIEVDTKTLEHIIDLI
ncbi:MAG: hypothetical protein KDB07_02075, partial [Planctomycetes bacterium]|nr:hypothetical protein [Planctomycetota bacterium]